MVSEDTRARIETQKAREHMDKGDMSGAVARCILRNACDELDALRARIAELEGALDLLFVNLFLKGDTLSITPQYASELMDIIEDVLPKEKDQDE